MPHHHWDDPDDTISNLLLQIPYVTEDDAPGSCVWEVDNNEDDLGKNFREVESKYLPEIESCIYDFCNSGVLPDHSPEAAYFLGWRAAVLQQFVISLGITHGSPIKTVFLHPPDMTIQETVQWLLLDWWNTFGPLEASKQRIEELYWKMRR